jgi:hypothetical protein
LTLLVDGCWRGVDDGIAALAVSLVLTVPLVARASSNEPAGNIGDRPSASAARTKLPVSITATSTSTAESRRASTILEFPMFVQE